MSRPGYRSYRPSPDLTGAVAWSWTYVVGTHRQRLVPDGCVELLVLDDGRLTVCGPDTTAWHIDLPPGVRAAGVRLHPGIAGEVLGVPARKLRDLRVPLEDLWGRAGRQEAQRVVDAAGTGARARALEDLVRRRRPEPDGFAATVVALLDRPRPEPAASLGEALGLSSRQVHRRCTEAFGFGPAFLARVLRLQRFLTGARTTSFAGRLALLSAEAGYADQAHLARDCRELAGVPPSALLAEPLIVGMQPR